MFTPHSSTLLYIQTPPVCFEVHREYGRRGKPLCVEKITRPPGADQRSKRVCLTEKGERFVKAHVDRVPEAEAAALGAMTAAERDALIRLTGRYRALFAQKLNCI